MGRVWPCFLSSYMKMAMDSSLQFSLLKVEIAHLPQPVLGCPVLQPQPLHWPLWHLLQYTGAFLMWYSPRLGRALRLLKAPDQQGRISPQTLWQHPSSYRPECVGNSLVPRVLLPCSQPGASWALGPLLLVWFDPSLSCFRASSVPGARLCFQF